LDRRGDRPVAIHAIPHGHAAVPEHDLAAHGLALTVQLLEARGLDHLRLDTFGGVATLPAQR
jgi:hypothetical protein